MIGAPYITRVAPFASATFDRPAGRDVSRCRQSIRRWSIVVERTVGSDVRAVGEAERHPHRAIDGFQSETVPRDFSRKIGRRRSQLVGRRVLRRPCRGVSTTMVSIPAMLTGTVYRNERNLQLYVRDHFEKVRCLSRFAQAASASTASPRCSTTTTRRRPTSTGCRAVRELSGGTSSLPDGSSRICRCFVMHRTCCGRKSSTMTLAPSDDVRPGDTRTRRFTSVNGAAVLGEFARHVKVGTSEPLYKFIHVGIPHLPFAVDANCALTGALRVTREAVQK